MLKDHPRLPLPPIIKKHLDYKEKALAFRYSEQKVEDDTAQNRTPLLAGYTHVDLPLFNNNDTE